jgi:hypothetical protein
MKRLIAPHKESDEDPCWVCSAIIISRLPKGQIIPYSRHPRSQARRQWCHTLSLSSASSRCVPARSSATIASFAALTGAPTTMRASAAKQSTKKAHGVECMAIKRSSPDRRDRLMLVSPREASRAKRGLRKLRRLPKFESSMISRVPKS